MSAQNRNEWNRIPTTDEAEKDATGDNRTDSNKQEYVNETDPALTEDDLRDNDLSIEEADNVEWEDDEME